jgi:hypothetical protein
MFTVTDLYLASFLLTRGHAVRVVKVPGGLPGQTHCQFLFPLAAEPDAELFANGQAVSAAGLADAHRRLKVLMARAPMTTQPTGAQR